MFIDASTLYKPQEKLCRVCVTFNQCVLVFDQEESSFQRVFRCVFRIFQRVCKLRMCSALHAIAAFENIFDCKSFWRGCYADTGAWDLNFVTI